MKEGGLRTALCCYTAERIFMNILNYNAPIIIGIDHGYGNILPIGK